MNKATKKETGKTKTFYADAQHEIDMEAIQKALSKMPYKIGKKYENESTIMNIGRRLVRKQIERKLKTHNNSGEKK